MSIRVRIGTGTAVQTRTIAESILVLTPLSHEDCERLRQEFEQLDKHLERLQQEAVKLFNEQLALFRSWLSANS